MYNRGIGFRVVDCNEIDCSGGSLYHSGDYLYYYDLSDFEMKGSKWRKYRKTLNNMYMQYQAYNYNNLQMINELQFVIKNYEKERRFNNQKKRKNNLIIKHLTPENTVIIHYLDGKPLGFEVMEQIKDNYFIGIYGFHIYSGKYEFNMRMQANLMNYMFKELGLKSFYYNIGSARDKKLKIAKEKLLNFRLVKPVKFAGKNNILSVEYDKNGYYIKRLNA